MSIRSEWCEYNKKTREYIYKRDKFECVICHSKQNLQIMHIFLSRAKGGKGCKENGCLGCIRCHSIIDNPIGRKQNELSKKYLDFCKKYIKQKENISSEYNLIQNTLKFNKKTANINKKELNGINILESRKTCKNCVYLGKNKNNRNINTYYCKLKKKIISKSQTCEEFKKVQ